ncbi:MAG: hypothetical protein PVI44_00055 [Balneolaceae bacterium]|jgi:hypothetical protein
MNLQKLPALIILALVVITSCSSIPDRPWSDAIPENAPYVIIPSRDATLNSVLSSSYTPFLDDITSSANQLLSQVDSTATDPINLKAIMLYPGANNNLETVWFANAPKGFIKLMKEHFYQNFTQNHYYFEGIVIHKLHLQNRILYAAQIHENLMLSESSLGIEDAIRAYLDKLPRADLGDLPLEPGHIIMNTPALDGWVEQLAKVIYRPVIKNALKGTKPALLSIEETGEQQNREFRLSGTIPLSKENIPDDLVAAISSANAPIALDRYISSNAAAFGFFRLEPRLAPPTSLPDTTDMDSNLMNDKVRYADIAKTIGPEFALVLYAKSGFLSTGEHVFLRKLKDPAAFRQELSRLANDDYIERKDGTYFIRSHAIAKLVGSSLCGFKDFYLDVSNNVAIISKRKGLVEMVSSDRSRRRTVYYDQKYREIKKQVGKQISGMFITGNDFYPFIKPFLAPDNYVNAVTSKFDLMAVSVAVNDNGGNRSLDFHLNTYQTKDRSAPYREKWLFPTGSDLSGEPVLTDIGGSSQQEVVFATKSGELFALASDGTVVMQANTGTDEPIGSPVVYDWYATNQNVILQAAGNKIYGWNDNGEPLPKFPFKLKERITSPLVVNDVDRNGLPNALVATADRKLHVLDGRGEDLPGWPVMTNAGIHTKPVVEDYRGAVSIIAFSENAVHAWYANGTPRRGFPTFLNASLNGSPIVYKNDILGNAADGYLYSVGPVKLFADSLNVFETTSDSSDIEAVYASNSSLTGTPSIQELTIQNESNTYREPMIITMSSNGSVFLMSTSGELRFTKNMGQPAAPSFSPFIADINKDKQDDLIALANFGRLYVWQVNNGDRIFTVPTSGMQYPIVTDLDEDGFNELISQTQEGLRCWTIYGKQ